MHITKSIISFIIFPLAQSLPQKHQPKNEFQITALNGKFPVSGPYGTGPIESSLSVTINYPDLSTSGSALSTTCSHSWPAGTPPGPTNWTACKSPAVQWRLPAAGWHSISNYRVEFWASNSNGTGSHATQDLTQNPSKQNDPNAFLSCLQMGKTTPQMCQLNGPLSAHAGPVVIPGRKAKSRPN
ncbi:hypothetical protein F5Y14DRAFT_271856 [Nemania sp. NC0429]|nr:hypothetical protein F5Y14DRAFT_271856 [Nemania sp. NC0429]